LGLFVVDSFFCADTEIKSLINFSSSGDTPVALTDFNSFN